MFISHRGNLNGPNKDVENHPDYLIETLQQGYNVETDVLYLKGNYYLGHDLPQYKIKLNFLLQSKLWLHCKNNAAFVKLLEAKTNCFFHESELVVLTGHGYKWYHSDSIDTNIEYDSKSVVAIPNQQYNIKGVNICSDYLL